VCAPDGAASRLLPSWHQRLSDVLVGRYALAREDVTDTLVTEAPRYTGVVCRRCSAPVAHAADEARSTMICPACGHRWDAPPPIKLPM
jgi:DNA-directed RNA polymerase subunit RPC12/RpoP